MKDRLEEAKLAYRRELENILCIIGYEVRPEQTIEELEAEHERFCQELEKMNESLPAEMDALLCEPDPNS